MTSRYALLLSATALLAACSDGGSDLREDVADEIAAQPEAVRIVGEDAEGGDYLNDARNPEGNRFLDGEPNDDATNDQPGFAEPEDAIDEDARPDD